jgi:hypothetical protein
LRFLFSGGRLRFRNLPLTRILSVFSAVIASLGAFRRFTSIRDGPFPFHPSRLRHRADCAVGSLSSFDRGKHSHHSGSQ